MGQIQGALVGIALVLSAVFMPMVFFGGSTGVIYRPFSITIVAAMALSVLVALIFTPALCTTLLKPGAWLQLRRCHGRGGADRQRTAAGYRLRLCGLSSDVHCQVGQLATIGPSAKNAILIVEFAKALHEQGMTLLESAVEACRMRLRPILMTSLAFIPGVVPLATSSGAGAGSRHAIGTGVIGGMFTVTVLAIFWVRLFHVRVSSWFTERSRAGQRRKRAVKQGRGRHSWLAAGKRCLQ